MKLTSLFWLWPFKTKQVLCTCLSFLSLNFGGFSGQCKGVSLVTFVCLWFFSRVKTNIVGILVVFVPKRTITTWFYLETEKLEPERFQTISYSKTGLTQKLAWEQDCRGWGQRAGSHNLSRPPTARPSHGPAFECDFRHGLPRPLGCRPSKKTSASTLEVAIYTLTHPKMDLNNFFK